MATVIGKPGLLGVQRFGHIVGVGLGCEQVIGYPRPFLDRKRGRGSQNATQRHRNIVNVVHKAYSFSRKRHGFSSVMDFNVYCRARAGPHGNRRQNPTNRKCMDPDLIFMPQGLEGRYNSWTLEFFRKVFRPDE
jgi:hypothetical protein